MHFKEMNGRFGEWEIRRMGNIPLLRIPVSPFHRFTVSFLCPSLITVIFIFALSSLLFASIKDRVVAFVDNTAITLSELEGVYSELQKVTPNLTKEEVLNTMVNRILLLREAKKIRLEAPSEDELLKEYIDLKIRIFIKIKEEDVLDFYQKHIEDFQGKEFETVREEIENYLTEAELNRLLKMHIDELRKKAYVRLQLTQPP
jgi:hypothetical protein